jgi:hypothetical protein
LSPAALTRDQPLESGFAFPVQGDQLTIQSRFMSSTQPSQGTDNL